MTYSGFLKYETLLRTINYLRRGPNVTEQIQKHVTGVLHMISKKDYIRSFHKLYNHYVKYITIKIINSKEYNLFRLI